MEDSDVAKICEKWKQAAENERSSESLEASTLKGQYASVKEGNVKQFIKVFTRLFSETDDGFIIADAAGDGELDHLCVVRCFPVERG